MFPVSDGCLLMFRFCRLRLRDVDTPPVVDLMSVSLLYPCVCVVPHPHPFVFACFDFGPDVCEDNPEFTDRQGSTCSYYQAINCSHEIMSEDYYAGVVENCPWSCGLCEGRFLYDTWTDLDTNPPVLQPPPPSPHPIHIEQSIMSNSYAGPPPFPAL